MLIKLRLLNYIIREMESNEYHLLDEFLYQAIFIPEGVTPPPKSIILNPTLRIYIDDFGKGNDDICLCAEVGEKVVGAVWTRIVNGFGHVDEETPEFAISLYKEYRSLGIGTEMMLKMLDVLRGKGYKRTTLAVQKANYALKMYQKVGFSIVDENEQEYIMEYQF